MTILRTLSFTIGLLAAAGAATAQDKMVITPEAARPAASGSAQYFTGSVLVRPVFPVLAPNHGSAGHVTFDPGARSAWHSHPAGQILYVTAGTGWVQEWNGPKREIKPGDVIWTPPGVKHWHGATSSETMSHLAIQEAIDGRNVDWMEQVSDEQYRR